MERKKKATRGRLSRTGTVIRCRVCKGTRHNRTSCSRRTGMETKVVLLPRHPEVYLAVLVLIHMHQVVVHSQKGSHALHPLLEVPKRNVHS